MKGKTGDRLAIFLPSLEGGGAERMMVSLANGMVQRGQAVDLVLGEATGPYLDQVDKGVRIVDLGAHRIMASLRPLARYLRRERPKALLSALSHANMVAIAARALARVPTRLVLSERASLAEVRRHENDLKARTIRLLMRSFYRKADAITVVAKAMIEEFLKLGLDPDRVIAIPNPVVTPDLLALSRQAPSHPFASAGEIPVILGVGRLVPQKDFATLIHAFAMIRRERPAKLLILGEGETRTELETLIEELGVADDVALPGFDANPFSTMRAASVYVLSSRYEGLPGALIQAMAVGTPVISTNCPTGPWEILEGGRWGRLVPVGDPIALAQAMRETLAATRHPDVALRASAYSQEESVTQYLAVLEPDRAA